MDKVRKTDRMIALTKRLSDMPNRLFPLSLFSSLFGAAKSTLSEDMGVIKQVLCHYGEGTLETVAGASGGVRYLPKRSEESTLALLSSVAEQLSEPQRVLPGGFLYMTDLLFSPALMQPMGEIFYTRFAETAPDAIMTIETKGIPLALMTARAFDLPLVVARQGSRVTEGPSVSINYVTGSGKRIQTMSLPKRSLPKRSRVLIIDDFMKAGGTARGMMELAHEIEAEVVGIGVLIATAQPTEKLVRDYRSLLTLQGVEGEGAEVDVRPTGPE